MTISSFLDGPFGDRNIPKESIIRLVGSIESAENLEATFSTSPHNDESQKQDALVAIPLFDYQQEIVVKLLEWHVNASSSRSLMVSLPTGAGKTRTCLAFVRLLQTLIPCNLVWLAPTTDLVLQAHDSLKSLMHKYGSFGEEIFTSITPVLSRDSSRFFFLTLQKAISNLSWIDSSEGSTILVIDEAHRVSASRFSEVVEKVYSYGNFRTVGLSATPGRHITDELGELSALFEGSLLRSEILGSDPVSYLVQENILSRTEIRTINESEVLMPRLRDDNYDKLTNSDLALNSIRFWSTVDTILSLPKMSSTLCYCESIDHAYILCAAVIFHQKKAAVLTNRTNSSRRALILDLFRKGEIDVLFNVRLLTTGFDAPITDNVVLATPIRSAIAWEQIIGRTTRGAKVGGGKNRSIIWELDDHRSLHKTVMAQNRYLDLIW